MRIRTNIVQISHTLIVLSIITAIIFYGQNLLKPIAFAIMFSILLKQPCSWLERKRLPSPVAILLIFFAVLLLLASLITVFSATLVNLFQDLREFGNNLTEIIVTVQQFIIDILPLTPEESATMMYEGRQELLKFSGSLLGPTLATSGGIIAYFGLTIVYSFFFLLYRKSIRSFFLVFFVDSDQEQVKMFLARVVHVLKSYFIGLIIVIIIMGILNSLGLYFIGVEHAVLFGFFAALLTIVPYLGTYIGAALPIIFVWLNTGQIMSALYVAIWFIIVQMLESNFITPKILGNQVSINPLFAFFALIIGGLLWGIVGMILFIPFIAIIKVICDHVPELRNIGVLLGYEFSSRRTNEPDKFTDRMKKFFND